MKGDAGAAARGPSISFLPALPPKLLPPQQQQGGGGSSSTEQKLQAKLKKLNRVVAEQVRAMGRGLHIVGAW